jgi:hypothetical protein
MTKTPQMEPLEQIKARLREASSGAVIRAGVDPSTVLFTHPVTPASDIARA